MNEKTIEEFKESIDSTSDEINDGINADGLSEEQAKEIYINQLKASKTRFVGTKHDGNTTVSKYGVGFKPIDV